METQIDLYNQVFNNLPSTKEEKSKSLDRQFYSYLAGVYNARNNTHFNYKTIGLERIKELLPTLNQGQVKVLENLKKRKLEL